MRERGEEMEEYERCTVLWKFALVFYQIGIDLVLLQLINFWYYND